MTDSTNNAGVYAVTLYPIGIPQTVVVDDQLPFGSDGKLLFGNTGTDGGLWGPILEKAFAKLSGNYEYISGGWVDESLRLLTGAPV